MQFLAEKEEKRQLEAKIAGMQSQLLIGGTKLEDVPAFRALLAKVRCMFAWYLLGTAPVVGGSMQANLWCSDWLQRQMGVCGHFSCWVLLCHGVTGDQLKGELLPDAAWMHAPTSGTKRWWAGVLSTCVSAASAACRSTSASEASMSHG